MQQVFEWKYYRDFHEIHRFFQEIDSDRLQFAVNKAVAWNLNSFNPKTMEKFHETAFSMQFMTSQVSHLNRLFYLRSDYNTTESRTETATKQTKNCFCYSK